MKDEIFGPLLPIFTFKHEEELFNILNANPDPLAFYVFARNTSWAKKLMHSRAFGNGAINNVLLQFSNKHLPFGGIGTSGYGTSHGKAGFDTFSQQKGLLRSATWLDPNLKYPPYSGFVYKFIRWLMR
jgi:aldehyde dehydrogenase (NAD+)